MAAVGLWSRAAVYLLLGALVAQIAAAGRATGPADTEGAFEAIAGKAGGPELLGVLAAGFAAYAVWRFVEAAARTPQGRRRTSPWTRVGWTAIGLVYVLLCAQAVRLAGGGRAKGPTQHPAPFAAHVLRLPLGPELLGVVATAIAAGGVALVVWGVGHDYRKDLSRRPKARALAGGAVVCAVAGNAARGAAVLLVASSLYASAVTDDPMRAKSLDAALRSLAAGPAGTSLLSLLALGFLAFGLYSLAEARYRPV